MIVKNSHSPRDNHHLYSAYIPSTNPPALNALITSSINRSGDGSSAHTQEPASTKQWLKEFYTSRWIME
jgi:hypothetical protein